MTGGFGNFGELTESLARDEGRARELREKVDEVEAELAGRTFVGSDRSRLVSVTLGRDGKIQDLSLADGWRRNTTPTRLPTTVIAAFDEARTTLRQEVARAYRAAGLSRIASNVSQGEEDDDIG